MDSKITNETNSDTQSRRPSLVVATMGTDGGIAKTTSANHLSDFYDEQGIPIARINCDVEKLQRGSFSSFHEDAINADIRTPAGADVQDTLNNVGSRCFKYSQFYIKTHYSPKERDTVNQIIAQNLGKLPEADMLTKLELQHQ